jgi:Flp pilus assembly protein TadD
MDRKRSEGNGPTLLKGGLLFGVALVASLGLGMLLMSDEPEPSRLTNVVPPAAKTTRPVASPAKAVTADVPVAPEAPAPVIVPAAAPEPEPVAPPTYAEAETAFLSGDHDEAVAALAAFTEANPEHGYGHYLYGLALRRAGELDRAEAAFLRSLAIAPEHGKSLVNLSRTLLDACRAKDALGPVTQAVELDPESVDALRAYAAALAVDPADAWSLNNSGLVLIEQEQWDEAAERLAAACEADATVAVFQNNRGVALERLERFDESRAAFAAAVELDGSYEKARVSLARVEGHVTTGAPADPAPDSGADLELAAGPSAPEPSPEPEDEL